MIQQGIILTILLVFRYRERQRRLSIGLTGIQWIPNVEDTNNDNLSLLEDGHLYEEAKLMSDNDLEWIAK